MTTEDYMKLLDRAMEKIPKKMSSSDRFEIPRLYFESMGSKTSISNFKEVCDRLNRAPSHFLRYLSKEMATKGNFDGNRVIFQGRFQAVSINNLLQIYVNRYVICPICKRPDTKLEKEGRIHILTCEACGARSPVPSI